MSTAAQTRQKGFYWVRPSVNGEWTIAHFGDHPGRAAWATTDEREWVDADFAEIDERPIQRQP